MCIPSIEMIINESKKLSNEIIKVFIKVDIDAFQQFFSPDQKI